MRLAFGPTNGAGAEAGAEAEAGATGIEPVLSIQLPLHEINCRRPATDATYLLPPLHFLSFSLAP